MDRLNFMNFGICSPGQRQSRSGHDHGHLIFKRRDTDVDMGTQFFKKCDTDMVMDPNFSMKRGHGHEHGHIPGHGESGIVQGSNIGWQCFSLMDLLPHGSFFSAKICRLKNERQSSNIPIKVKNFIGTERYRIQIQILFIGALSCGT